MFSKATDTLNNDEKAAHLEYLARLANMTEADKAAAAAAENELEDQYRMHLAMEAYLNADEDSVKELAYLLRCNGFPISNEFRNFIADILEGKAKQKAGPKQKLSDHERGERWIEYMLLCEDIKTERAGKKTLRGALSVGQEALERMRKKYHVSRPTVDKWIFTRKLKA